MEPTTWNILWTTAALIVPGMIGLLALILNHKGKRDGSNT